MSNVLWKSLLISPSVLGATLLSVASTIATPIPETAKIIQPQVEEKQVPKVNSEAIASSSTKVSEADAATVFSIAATESEQPTVASSNTPTFQVAETPATELDQQAIKQLQIPERASVTPSEQQTSKPDTGLDTTETPAVSSPTAISENNLDQINRYSSEGKGNTSIAQVTSVSQLSDVQPTDWAFQALQSLVERYGCIVGYPDGTYRGNRATTRYEFAAGLNACLDRINELIATATSDLVTREDLATLQRLQEEFAAELAVLRGRVDALEAKTAELEANQFSTTTKLVGEVIVAVSDEFSADDFDNNTVLQDRVRLYFNTSFTGEDLLVTRLSAGNANPFGIPGGGFEGFQNISFGGVTGNDVVVDWVAYYFNLGENLRVYLPAFAGLHYDYAPTINPFLDNFDGGNGPIGFFGQRNPIYNIGGGSGLAFNYKFSEALGISAGYLADDSTDPGGLGGASVPTDDNGLFNGSYSALAQISFTPGNFQLGLTYVNAYRQRDIFDTGFGTGVEGTVLANFGNFFDNVTDESALSTEVNAFGASAAYKFGSSVAINAFFMYADVDVPTSDIDENGEVWSGGIGLAFQDLGKTGSLLGLIAGVEPYLGNPRDFGSLCDAEDNCESNDFPLHFEGFYKYQLTDNIALTPGVIWIVNPGQNDSNDDVIIGTLRTTFNF